ncbi:MULTISPECIES: hypothetical protein [unclassified Clostridioides]|uniref:hypothetical protein n=1 Tax=unclassified Clostridioides TaxID=2635829 RepID=UPI001D11B752|nr:hypothetical protein [Clostridioides sp. ES-S-0049-03]MCC0678433.1 hypothetical protein [Clostridioides sp. ES-W-0018-02]MCC0682514.1 hypothetical protein [Clostridioides sp. ES-S-0005-03]MCC0707242.1 hypothetical protein [Clostridioides sp. ES-S-0190-01]MCC0713260.1 hypothetical protein [Clostridioides sp. ES-W-0017-02]
MVDEKHKELIKMLSLFKKLKNINQSLVYKLSLEIISNRKDIECHKYNKIKCQNKKIH